MTALDLVYKLPAILLAITVHEYAHGRAADSLGDPTARASGRLTLNPLSHLDPMGFICLLLAGFGWAKPVPVNPNYFQNPMRGMMLSSAAGPLANLGTAVACGIVFRVLAPDWDGILAQVLTMAVFYNVALALFNLLPIHPLDGSHVLKGLLPTRIAIEMARYDRVMMYLLFAVITVDAIFRTRIIGHLLMAPIRRLSLIIIGW